MATLPIFRVIFQNQGEVFEIYARQIFQSELWGFIEVEEFIFGQRSQLLFDQGEEKLKAAFDGVKRSYIPLNTIIRIDEVEKEGAGKVSEAKGDNVRPFPVMPHIPSRDWCEVGAGAPLWSELLPHSVEVYARWFIQKS